MWIIALFESHCAWVYICLYAPSSKSICSYASDVILETHNSYKLYSNLQNVSDLAFIRQSLKFKDDPIFNKWFKSKSGFMHVQSDAAEF